MNSFERKYFFLHSLHSTPFFTKNGLRRILVKQTKLLRRSIECIYLHGSSASAGGTSGKGFLSIIGTTALPNSFTFFGATTKIQFTSPCLPRSYLILSLGENKSPVIDSALVQFVFVKTQFP